MLVAVTAAPEFSKLSAEAPFEGKLVKTLNVIGVSSLVITASFAVSATGVTVILVVAVALKAPPVPVLPLSLMVTESDAVPLKSAVGA